MILNNTSIHIKNSIFKIKKDKCLKDLILNPFRYSEVISQWKLIGGLYTSAQTALGAQASTRSLGVDKVWAWTTIKGVDDDQGRGADKLLRSVRVDEVISHPTGTHRRKPEKPQYSGNIGNQAENRARQDESRYKII